jgi:hypothetical protein
VPNFPRPSAAEILSALPGLSPYARRAVILDVSRGAPGVRDSSIGGPLLWPRTETWPSCSFPDEVEESGLPAVAMVPVAQIFAADVPGPWWPEGFDLLQLLWCPNTHWETPGNQAEVSPIVELRWRRAADVHDILETPPQPARYDVDDCYTLTPCSFTTEELTDFPYYEELPEALRPPLQKLIERHSPPGTRGDVITCLPGWKVGGWPTWRLNEPRPIDCEVCGTAMVLLFTIASDDTVGTNVGRFGELRIFVCPDHPGEFEADQH